MSNRKAIAIMLGILLAYGLVGRMDYEDELARQAERDAYTKALAMCGKTYVLAKEQAR